MAGTINLSLTQQLDEFGEPLSGGALYFIHAGTVATPQNAYQDLALTVPWPNPIVLDAAGRIPQFFLADGQIKVRLQDRFGVVKFVADQLLVIGPSSTATVIGGVDATAILTTGDIKVRYDTAILSGFVRANGNTIGNATSGATELADVSAQSLFQFLWNVDSTLPVSGGRGASGPADWAASKQLTLPDFRGRIAMGLDGMGGPSSGLFSGMPAFTHGNSITLGSYSGAYMKTIPLTAMPTHRHGMVLIDPTHAHTYSTWSAVYTAAGGGTAVAVATTTGTTSSASTGAYVTDGAGNTNQTTAMGSSAAMDMSPAFLMITVYIKL